MSSEVKKCKTKPQPSLSLDEKRRIDASLAPKLYQDLLNNPIEFNHDNYSILPADDISVVNNKIFMTLLMEYSFYEGDNTRNKFFLWLTCFHIKWYSGKKLSTYWLREINKNFTSPTALFHTRIPQEYSRCLENSTSAKVNLSDIEILKILEELQKYLQSDVLELIQKFRNDWSLNETKYTQKLSSVEFPDKITDVPYKYSVQLMIKFVENMSNSEICANLTPEHLCYLLKTVSSTIFHYLMYVETPISLIIEVMDRFPFTFSKLKYFLSKYKKLGNKMVGNPLIFLYQVDSHLQEKFGLWKEFLSKVSKIESERELEESSQTSNNHISLSSSLLDKKTKTKKMSTSDIIKTWRVKTIRTSSLSSSSSKVIKPTNSSSHKADGHTLASSKSEFDSLTYRPPISSEGPKDDTTISAHKFNMKKIPRVLRRITQDLSVSLEEPNINNFTTCNLECVNSYQDVDLTNSGIVGGSFSSSNPDLVEKMNETDINSQEIILEFIMTEKNYVQQLVILEKIFHPKLLQTNCLETNIIQSLFYGLDTILDIHFEFVKSLTNIKDKIISIEKFIDVVNPMFLGPNCEKLKFAYANYCAIQQDCLAALKLRIETNPELDLFFRHHQKLQFMRRLSFIDIRASVYQRIVKYPILFMSFLKNLSLESPSYSAIIVIMNKCKAIVDFVNSANDEYNKYLRFLNYKSRVNWKVFRNFKGDESNKKFIYFIENLNFSSEMLIYETTATVSFGHKKYSELTVLVLTNYMIFLSKVSERKYNLLPLSISKGQVVTPVIPLDGLIIRRDATSRNGLYMMSLLEAEPLIVNLTLAKPTISEKMLSTIEEHLENLSRGTLKQRINSELLQKILTGQVYESSQTDTSLDNSSAKTAASADDSYHGSSIERSIHQPEIKNDDDNVSYKRINKSTSVYIPKNKTKSKIKQNSNRCITGTKIQNRDIKDTTGVGFFKPKGKSEENITRQNESNDSEMQFNNYSESNISKIFSDNQKSWDSSGSNFSKLEPTYFTQNSSGNNSIMTLDDTLSEATSSELSSIFKNETPSISRNQSVESTTKPATLSQNPAIVSAVKNDSQDIVVVAQSGNSNQTVISKSEPTVAITRESEKEIFKTLTYKRGSIVPPSKIQPTSCQILYSCNTLSRAANSAMSNPVNDPSKNENQCTIKKRSTPENSLKSSAEISKVKSLLKATMDWKLKKDQ